MFDAVHDEKHPKFSDGNRQGSSNSTPTRPPRARWILRAGGCAGGDSYPGFRTVGNHTTAMILHSVKKDILWSFDNRTKSWYR